MQEDELGGPAKYLQKHRPDKFLGGLCIWYQYAKCISSDLAEHVRDTKVLCRGNRHALLKDAYFPAKELERRVQRFIGPDVFFPWLWLDTETTDPDSPFPWMKLLEQLKVGTPETDLDLALDMLKCFLDAFPSHSLPQGRSRLFGLYHHIQSKYIESEHHSQAAEKIRYVAQQPSHGPLFYYF